MWGSPHKVDQLLAAAALHRLALLQHLVQEAGNAGKVCGGLGGVVVGVAIGFTGLGGGLRVEFGFGVGAGFATGFGVGMGLQSAS